MKTAHEIIHSHKSQSINLYSNQAGLNKSVNVFLIYYPKLFKYLRLQQIFQLLRIFNIPEN